ncbi:MAG: N-acetylmuramoyl-L-alanine amidase [Ruminococcaceae bacterium]|nr:N-acetylmuramoyl-L-alanine amidase [Oscillospiraceae bacterium]
MPNRTRKKTYNDQTLLLLVGVLVVVLIGVICLAIVMGDAKPEADPGSSEASTEASIPSQSTPLGLTMTNPQQQEMVVMEDKMVFEGFCDPSQTLLINGLKITPREDGGFTHTEFLVLGENEITVTYQGEDRVYRITRRYVVASCEPMGAQNFSSGATVYFKISARAGSQVSASFNGKTIQLAEDKFQMGVDVPEGFLLYTGEYKLPSTNLSDVDLGVITYTATCDGIEETFTSGNITCLRPADVLASDPSVTPNYGDYINVGSGYIVEIINHTAETFYGATVDDYSHPVNNYLPAGTVDYCSTQTVKLGSLSYVVLRSGQRVYVEMRNNPTLAKIPMVDRYRGKLPDHNEIGFVSMTESGRHTVLTLDCLWKAPFYFDLKPQSYQNPANSSDRNYSITALTAEYVDITFCYATVFTGEISIPANNPLFKSAELIRRESDCTLRLYLKKVGGFYGWDSYYNENDQLCFQFLNPAKVTASENALGADLTGIKVFIDVGHGGSDPGTVAKTESGQSVYEADRNLVLALAVKKYLEDAGAEVILDRTTDVRITVDERARMLKQEKPDYCLSIHHNSIGGYPNFDRFETFYFTPFAQLATKFIKNATAETGVYSNSIMNWHHFFLARQTVCPVVLAENGYMSCNAALEKTLDPEIINIKAQALAKGVADYFLEINK